MNQAAGHWYSRDGNSAHEMPNKSKGGTRPTTITDAKKLGLLPSVTTIMKALAKPQLDRWCQEQVAFAAWANPPKAVPSIEGKEEYAKRIIDLAFEQVDDAADLGTAVHAAVVDSMFHGKTVAPELAPYVEKVRNWTRDQGIEFVEHELRLVCEEFGFAGTTDGIVSRFGAKGVLDLKTRKTKPQYPCTPWETEPMQIAAYSVAKWGVPVLDDPLTFGVNVYLSTTEPDRKVEAAFYDAARLRKEWEAFQAICHVWRHVKGYDPRKKQ